MLEVFGVRSGMEKVKPDVAVDCPSQNKKQEALKVIIRQRL